MKIFGTFLAGVGLVVIVSFLMAGPIMLLWNYCLVDAVTVFKEIGWLQAWGISVLASFLFKTTTSS